jgi:hypothetical protein
MTFVDIARRWTILILAETLKISVGAVEAILPFQPRWLAQIALLATHLRAAADGAVVYDADDEVAAGDVVKLPSFEVLLASHGRLRQALLDIGGRGLALDDGLLTRMRKDWSRDSVISYLTSAEANLRDNANRALDEAAAPLGMTAAAMTALDGGPHTAPVPPAPRVAAKQPAKPVPAAPRRREQVR